MTTSGRSLRSAAIEAIDRGRRCPFEELRVLSSDSVAVRCEWHCRGRPFKPRKQPFKWLRSSGCNGSARADRIGRHAAHQRPFGHVCMFLFEGPLSVRNQLFDRGARPHRIQCNGRLQDNACFAYCAPNIAISLSKSVPAKGLIRKCTPPAFATAKRVVSLSCDVMKTAGGRGSPSCA